MMYMGYKAKKTCFTAQPKLLYNPAGIYTMLMVLASVKLLHELGKLPASWQLVKLMEPPDIC